MAEVHKSPIRIAHRNASTPRLWGKPAAQRAGQRAIPVPLIAVIRPFAAVLAWPATTVGRLLLRSQGNRVRGYRRSGYPEMDHWTAGRRSDK